MPGISLIVPPNCAALSVQPKCAASVCSLSVQELLNDFVDGDGRAAAQRSA
jgi:hypothetical protein